MSVKRLVVNADDLGRSAGVNEGIFRAHREGIVTSATLLVDSPAARDVPGLAAGSPQLGIGLQVAPEGLDAGQVLSEARAQLKRFREIMGREPTHFSGHPRSCRSPAVLEALVTLAWETGLAVRAASPNVAERLRGEGIKTTDGLVEGPFGERGTEEDLLRILEDVPVGTTELVCRPGLGEDERARELAALISPALRPTLQATGLRLIHFGQL